MKVGYREFYKYLTYIGVYGVRIPYAELLVDEAV